MLFDGRVLLTFLSWFEIWEDILVNVRMGAHFSFTSDMRLGSHWSRKCWGLRVWKHEEHRSGGLWSGAASPAVFLCESSGALACTCEHNAFPQMCMFCCEG